MGSPLSILDYRQPVEFRMGEVLVRTWNILSRHFVTFALLVGIAELLPLMVNIYIVNGEFSNPLGIQFAILGSRLLSFLLGTFAQAIVIYAAFQDLRGRHPNAAESTRTGLSRVFPVIVASIMTILVVIVGFALCIIPGLIAYTAMVVVIPACVVEQLGPIDSMSRSADLTSGHRWPILGVGAAYILILIGVSFGLSAMANGKPNVALLVAEWAWGVVATSFTSVYAAILYHDLRAVREGIGIDEIASVFD